MIKVLVYSLFLTALWSIFSTPWVTTAVYFLNGVMQPRFLWRWTFPDISLSKYLAIASIVGWMIAVARKKIDYQIYLSPQNYLLLFIWGMMHLSNLVSDYPKYMSGASTDIILDSMNTIMIMYFVSIGILSDFEKSRKALIWFGYIFVVIGAYYSYWANDLYLSSRWDMFQNGRLRGPYYSPYRDENFLATLVVMCMPFLLLGFFYMKNFYLRWLCLGGVPFLWHAIILFGSRGALLGLAVSTLLLASLLKKKRLVDGVLKKVKGVAFYKGVILTGLIAAIIYQGGVLLTRTTNTVDAAQLETEQPLNPRLVSWGVGIDIIKEAPLLGVGPQRFLIASHLLFPERAVHVAHNTFINFSANNGLPVGLSFLLVLFLCHRRYKECTHWKFAGCEEYEYIAKASYCSIAGFAVCSIFLDLVAFEGFYLAIMLSFASHYMIKKKIELERCSQLGAVKVDHEGE